MRNGKRGTLIQNQETLNKPVFFGSTIIIAIITLFGSIWADTAEVFFKAIQTWLITNTSWIYVLTAGTLLLFALWLIFTRMGDIKLGPDHSEPEYSNLSWFAMLFSAGMGIGLLFFGVAEPMMHFTAPPVGDPGNAEAAREAMKITFFHWGLHAWAIYAVFAVILAYFAYRKELPLLPRSAFYPLIGDKIYGPIGHLVDSFCVIGTLFGVATSLGFGVSQVNAGLNYLFGVPQTTGMQVGLIIAITSMATISVVLGLDGGIKRLSNINMIIAVLLMVVIMLLGDSMGIMKAFVQNTGAYLSDIVYKTFNLYTYEKKDSWIGGWTLLYWGWWVSWAPFVGMFIARISRGRSIREFMTGILFVPTGFTFLWMTVFGHTAISMSLAGTAGDLAQVVNSNVPVALFKFFELFPFSALLSGIGLVLVVTFFVSSSDSGSLVVDTLASGGMREPPVWQRIYWASMEGLVAAVLLLAGGLDALQTMTIAAAFPMIFMIGISCYTFFQSLRSDYLLSSAVHHHSTSVQYAEATTPWQKRLEHLVKHPKHSDAEKFLNETVRPALKELSEELIEKGFSVKVELEEKNRARIVLKKDDVEDFFYGVRLRSFVVPSYAQEDQENYYRAEVFLRQGGQDYDVFGYTREQIIADAISQYERHLYFLHLANAEQPD